MLQSSSDPVPIPIVEDDVPSTPVTRHPQSQIHWPRHTTPSTPSRSYTPVNTSPKVTPSKKTALSRELNRIGDFNKPGLLEVKSPLPRTRSGKVP